MGLTFEWDPKKAAQNQDKHGVSFGDATTVFSDPLSVTSRDPDHSVGEDRFLTMGMSRLGMLVTVAHTDRENRIRIITARKATRPERRFYEEHR